MVSVPLPCFEPRIPFAAPPANNTSLLIVSARPAPLKSIGLLKVIRPLSVALPRVVVVVILVALASVRAVVLSDDSEPPLNVSGPLPNTLSLPTRNFPAERILPPEKPLLKLIVAMPDPIFDKLAVLVNAPGAVRDQLAFPSRRYSE